MRIKNILLVIVFFLILSMPENSSCKMRHQTKIRVGVPPYEVLADIIKTNIRQAESSKDHKTSGKGLYLAWLADSDSRISPYMILGNSRNKIYSIRNFGFQINEAIKTVDFGILHLHAPVLLITGNTENLATLYALKEFNQLDQAMQKQLLPLRKVVLPDNGKKKFTKKEFEVLLHQAVEKNVDHQVDLAIKRYKKRLKSGRLVIVGSVLDIHNEYGLGEGSLVIININGETKDSALKQHHSLIKFNSQMLKAVGRKVRNAP